ncbi:M16 family metallopeptidase [Aliihoeflea aestuarii]|uniref:M16 family metallopeptidase n=1 Tax=Aliihoeflea aestuarii TaxID=453840 RepID=UPI0020934127|nr:pitrilysin family protein [Aliihoeflea aestuarii]
MHLMQAAARTLASTAIGLALLAGPALAQDASPAEAGNEVVDFKLDNGLEVVVIPDRRAPVVTHMLWIKVGSADEEPGKSGIAHFLEHLMFKGTEAHPQGEFSARIAEVGGRENAFTSYDYTAYFQQVAPEHLEEMMEFESDRLTGLVLTDEVVDPERQVVIEERNSRIETRPNSILGESLNATLYQNSGYGVPIIGWMHEIEKLNREDAIEFYQRYYAPNNAILVVAGDVDAQDVRALAEEYYGPIPANPELGERTRTQEPLQRTARTVTFNDERVTVPGYSKTWLVPSYTTADEGEAESLDLLAEILGGGMRSRLYQSLVVEQGIASSAGAYYRGTSLNETAFGVYGAPRGDATLEDVERAADAEIVKIAEDGITQDELEAAKNRYLRSIIFARDDQSGMANMYGSALTTGSTVRDIEEWPDRIRAVEADDIKAAAARYLDRSRAVTGYLLPPEEEPS